MDRASGTLVWAKLKYAPYWPAVMCAKPPKLRKRQISSRKCCVLFFGTKNYGIIEPTMIEDYLSNFEKYKDKGRGDVFRNAILQSQQYSDDPNNFRSNAEPRKGKVLVKIERDDAIAPELISYDVPSGFDNENQSKGSEERLLEELSSLRAKYNETFFQLQKANENLKSMESQMVESSNRCKQKDKLLTSLGNDNRNLSGQLLEATDRINSLQQQLIQANDQIKSLQSSQSILIQKQSDSLRASKSKSAEVNEAKQQNRVLQARIVQIQRAGAIENKAGVDGNLYSVEQILDHKCVRKTRKFLVRWEGYDSSEDSWVKESDLHCDKILLSYLESKGLN